MSNLYPKLELFEDYENDWDSYIEAIYTIFKTDFIYGSPKWSPDNVPVHINSSPMDQQKEYTFWHITSTGKIEADRVPDFRRCERIRYPRFLIASHPSALVNAWVKDVKKGQGGIEKRIHLSNDDYTYLAVLSPNKKSKRTLVTAYYVEKTYQRKKLEKDHQRFKI